MYGLGPIKKKIMKDFILTGWQDYWKIFDELIEQLTTDNKTEIVLEFKEAQEFVNGLTDGWYKFKLSFEKALHSNRYNMTDQQN